MKARDAFLLTTLLCASALVSCTDPVIDNGIQDLGDEPGFYYDSTGKKVGTDEGENHRQGQPCVLCHQKAGNATPFILGGTVYENDTEKKGAPNVQVLLVDGFQHKFIAKTNKSGNFYVTTDDWPDFEGFPLRTGVFREDVSQKNMLSHIGREPSCSACHRDPKKNVKDDKLSAVGHIYLPAKAVQ